MTDARYTSKSWKKPKHLTKYGTDIYLVNVSTGIYNTISDLDATLSELNIILERSNLVP